MAGKSEKTLFPGGKTPHSSTRRGIVGGTALACVLS